MQNAARFTKQGFVCVRCSVEPAAGGGLSAKFAVLDSGSGMSDATKATLFDLYKSVGGIGLGMFLSSKLLSLLGTLTLPLPLPLPLTLPLPLPLPLPLTPTLTPTLGSKIEVESPWRSDGPGAAFYFSVDMAMSALVPDAVDSMAAVQEVTLTPNSTLTRNPLTLPLLLPLTLPLTLLP